MITFKDISKLWKVPKSHMIGHRSHERKMIEYFLPPEDPDLMEKAFDVFGPLSFEKNILLARGEFVVCNDLMGYQLNQCLKIDSDGAIIDGYCILGMNEHLWGDKPIWMHLIEHRGLSEWLENPKMFLERTNKEK